MTERDTNTVIIGAGAAGLAAGACLEKQSVPFILLEQTQQVGNAWRHHYDRLHLHTSKGLSALPFRPFPADVPKYPSREQVVAYLEAYAQAFGLQPRFGQAVQQVATQAGVWLTETQDTVYRSRNVVIATGYTRQPHRPTWLGLEAFTGEVIHSSVYKNGRPYQDQDVLVVGFGNSGGEIAIDLWEHGARPAVSVRSPVNVIPRDLFGIPILGWGIVLSKLPAPLADFLSAPLIRFSIGDLTRYGLRKPSYGPLTQIKTRERIPLLDIGTVRLIKEEKLTVFPGIERFTPEGVVFVDGRERPFAAVVLATGYRPALADFLAPADQVTDETGLPPTSGVEAALPGLFFCGFYVSPTGMLREIGIEAQHIADAIGRKSA